MKLRHAIHTNIPGVDQRHGGFRRVDLGPAGLPSAQVPDLVDLLGPEPGRPAEPGLVGLAFPIGEEFHVGLVIQWGGQVGGGLPDEKGRGGGLLNHLVCTPFGEGSRGSPAVALVRWAREALAAPEADALLDSYLERAIADVAEIALPFETLTEGLAASDVRRFLDAAHAYQADQRLNRVYLREPHPWQRAEQLARLGRLLPPRLRMRLWWGTDVEDRSRRLAIQTEAREKVLRSDPAPHPRVERYAAWLLDPARSAAELEDVTSSWDVRSWDDLLARIEPAPAARAPTRSAVPTRATPEEPVMAKERPGAPPPSSGPDWDAQHEAIQQNLVEILEQRLEPIRSALQRRRRARSGLRRSDLYFGVTLLLFLLTWFGPWLWQALPFGAGAVQAPPAGEASAPTATVSPAASATQAEAAVSEAGAVLRPRGGSWSADWQTLAQDETARLAGWLDQLLALDATRISEAQRARFGELRESLDPAAAPRWLEGLFHFVMLESGKLEAGEADATRLLNLSLADLDPAAVSAVVDELGLAQVPEISDSRYTADVMAAVVIGWFERQEAGEGAP